MSATEGIDRKYSVYVALVVLAGLAAYDLQINGGIEATKDILLGLLGFAGARQAIKSFLQK